jgi:hypothetical protein
MTHRRLTAKHLQILYLLNESHWPVIYSYGLFPFTDFSSMGDGKLLIHGSFLQIGADIVGVIFVIVADDTGEKNRWIMQGASAQYFFVNLFANVNAWAIIFSPIYSTQFC